jgi:hypothetical protein
MLLALISAFRTLVLDLSRRGVIDADEFGLHREAAYPNNLADAIHALSEHLQDSVVLRSREGDVEHTTRTYRGMIKGRNLAGTTCLCWPYRAKNAYRTPQCFAGKFGKSPTACAAPIQ